MIAWFEIRLIVIAMPKVSASKKKGLVFKGYGNHDGIRPAWIWQDQVQQILSGQDQVQSNMQVQVKLSVDWGLGPANILNYGRPRPGSPARTKKENHCMANLCFSNSDDVSQVRLQMNTVYHQSQLDLKPLLRNMACYMSCCCVIWVGYKILFSQVLQKVAVLKGSRLLAGALPGAGDEPVKVSAAMSSINLCSEHMK